MQFVDEVVLKRQPLPLLIRPLVEIGIDDFCGPVYSVRQESGNGIGDRPAAIQNVCVAVADSRVGPGDEIFAVPAHGNIFRLSSRTCEMQDYLVRGGSPYAKFNLVAANGGTVRNGCSGSFHCSSDEVQCRRDAQRENSRIHDRDMENAKNKKTQFSVSFVLEIFRYNLRNVSNRPRFCVATPR